MLSQSAVEMNVLTLLVYSDEHAPLIALKITDSELFSNPSNKLIVQTALAYLSKYNQPPKGALQYLLEADLKRGEQGKLLGQTLAELEKENGHVDAAFVLEELDKFLEQQRMTRSCQEALELLMQGELDRAKETIYKASSAPDVGTSGIWMKDPVQALRFLQKDEYDEFFSSGIGLLDARKIKPERKTLMIIVASSGKGKSWWLINVGKAALQHHKKVLHITLEMDEEKTAARYLQSIFNYTRSEAQEIIPRRFLRGDNGEPNGQVELLPSQTYICQSLVQDQARLRRRILEWESCPKWLIKQFPTGMLSVEQLAMYMDGLERKERFRPDLLIIDYADIMRIDSANLRIDTGRLYRELRGLAVMRNIAVVTATQGNRESELAKVVGRTNVAEDWSKVGTVDTMITYSQTEEEKRRELARIYVAKARDTPDGFMCLIQQEYVRGQFCLDAIKMTAEISNQLQGGTS